jgi:hypothetical protein
LDVRGRQELLHDPRVDQSSRCIDLATANFHEYAVSFSGFEALVNSAQIFAHSHSRLEGLLQARLELRTAWLLVSIVRNNFIRTCFSVLPRISFAHVDNTVHSNDFFRTLTTCSLFFSSVRDQTH